MSKIIGLTLVAVIAFLSVAETGYGYYVTLPTWWYWVPNKTATISSVAQAPDAISGNNYGVLMFRAPASGGDGGNFFMPLTTSTWMPNHSYELGFDVKILHADAGQRGVFYARGLADPGIACDTNWLESYGSPLYDGNWHHVDVSFTMPEGFIYTNGSGWPIPAGTYNFTSMISAYIEPIANSVAYGSGQYTSMYLDNFSFKDTTTNTEMAINGSFNTYTGTAGQTTAYPTSYVTSPAASGNYGTLLYVNQVPVPEPTTLALLALGALGLVAGRKA